MATRTTKKSTAKMEATVGQMVLSKSENARREQYEITYANIRPLMVRGKGATQKVITGSVSVPLSLCFIDARYQGLRTHKYIKKLENKWDERKLTPIIIVPHPEEFRFAVVDGQGRCTVAPNKGMASLNAIVLMDAPDNLEERLKFEAEYFIGQDSEVEKVKPLEKHLSRCIIGDSAALCLDELLKKYQINIINKAGQRSHSVLGSYSDTYMLAKVHGEKCLEFIFSLIENAGWSNEPNGYSKRTLRTIKEIWFAHPNDRDAIHELLSKKLRKIDPKHFTSSSITKYPKRDEKISCILYLEDIICEELGLERKIYTDGDKKWKTLQ